MAKWTTIAFFLLPALVLFVVLVLWPVVQAGFFSVFRWNGLGPPTDLVGLDNFTNALRDRAFISAIAHNAIIVVLSLVLQLPLALALALLLNSRIRGRGALRILFFTPYVLSEVITAVVWSLILRPNGLADGIVEGIGLGALVPEWLGDRNVVLFTVFLVVSWKYFGFHMILYLTGLQQVPVELEEAAAIDGATRLQAIRHVVIPLLGPTIRVSIFLSIIGSLQLFDLVWVMTGGGPVNASNTMATYMIQWGFDRSQLGYGSAVAVILAVLSLVVALAYQRFVLRRDVEGALTSYAG